MKDMFADSGCDFLLFSGSDVVPFVKSVFLLQIQRCLQKCVKTVEKVAFVINNKIPVILHKCCFSNKK